MAKILVADEKEINSGFGKMVTVNGKTIGLFRVGKTIFAMAGTCAHRGGPVGEGELKGSLVTCPWHGWQYDVTTGECKTAKGVKLPTYKALVEAGRIYLEL